jgi:hypothetical protein
MTDRRAGVRLAVDVVVAGGGANGVARLGRHAPALETTP